MEPIVDTRPGVRQQASAITPPTKTAAAPIFGPKEWFSAVVVGAIVSLLALIAYRVVVPSDDEVSHRKVMAALARCQQAIQSTAQYGGADTPPYVKNYGKGDEFYFAWPAGSFEFSNGFGARVKMSASCIGDIPTGEIKSLTINGKDIL
jgi:hypothetical protein